MDKMFRAEFSFFFVCEEDGRGRGGGISEVVEFCFFMNQMTKCCFTLLSTELLGSRRCCETPVYIKKGFVSCPSLVRCCKVFTLSICLGVSRLRKYLGWSRCRDGRGGQSEESTTCVPTLRVQASTKCKTKHFPPGDDSLPVARTLCFVRLKRFLN